MSSYAEFHDELRSVAREVLGDGGFAADWLGLEVPEALGGSGASFAETAVVAEEVGRAAAAHPFLGAVLGVGALQLAEPTGRRDELLAGVAAGETIVAVAAPSFRVESGHVTGRATFVADVVNADRLLLLAGAALVEVESADVVPTPTLDETRSFGEVVVDGAAVIATMPLAGDPHELQQRGALAVALDSLGIGEAMLDATVAYACVRQQFGQPIGSFQAVKHACADMRVELAVSRQLVAAAVGRPTDDVAVSMAKAHATETAVEVAGTAMQLHGGVGYTWEAGVHAYLKRAALNRALFGSPAEHRARLARRYTTTV
jgi:alkylation response protein AidB-like acyl-CoA dehydrogenase